MQTGDILSGCCESNIISLVMGFILSLIATIIILVISFHYSIANHRLNFVIKGSKKLIANKKNSNNLADPLQNEFRYSFGVMVFRLIENYGLERQDFKRIRTFPSMIYNAKDNTRIDGWQDFNLYVRPVMEDIATFSLLKILSFFPKYKRLYLLQKLCVDFEIVTSKLDSIRLLSDNRKIELIRFNRITVGFIADDEVDELDQLKLSYQDLYEHWFAWLRLL